MDNKALIGLMSGVGFVVATLVAVALLNTPSAESATAQAAQAACSRAHGAVSEQGYGVAPASRACKID